MSCVVQDLPCDVQILLWKDWIKISELAMLDSAVCSVEIRPSLLAVLNHDFFVYNSQFEHHDSTDFVIWLSIRRIKTDYLDLSPFLNDRIPSMVTNYILSSRVTSLKMSYSANLLLILNAIGNNVANLSTNFENLGSKKFVSLILRIPNVTDLEIDTESLLSCEDCETLVEHCPSLTSLNSIGYDSAESVKVVINGLNLSALNLPNVRLIDDDTVDLITTKLSNLEELTLHGQHKITDESILKLAIKCDKLKHLDLRSCEVSDVSLIQIVSKCNHLTGLYLSYTSITDETLFALSKKGDDCSLLSLFVCHTAITDKGVCSFVTKCSAKLEELYTSGCVSVTDVSLACISTHCPKLSSLHCRGCTFSDPSSFTALMKNPMEGDFVTGKAQIVDLLASIMHGFKAICLTEYITSNSFAYWDYVNFDICTSDDDAYGNVCVVKLSDPVITSQLFRQIVLQCPDLSLVLMDSSLGVDDDDIEFLLEKNPNIRALCSISKRALRRTLDCKMLLRCVTYCQYLEEFHLRHVDLVSFDSFISFFTAIGKSLQLLMLVDCRGLDNAGLVTIAALCPNLVSLTAELSFPELSRVDLSIFQLGSPEAITPMTNKSILESCPLLEHLHGKETSEYRFLRQGAI